MSSKIGDCHPVPHSSGEYFRIPLTRQHKDTTYQEITTSKVFDTNSPNTAEHTEPSPRVLQCKPFKELPYFIIRRQYAVKFCPQRKMRCPVGTGIHQMR